MRIAFFDFDGTLTRHDSFIAFARQCVGNARLLLAVVRSSPMLLLWKLGIKTNSDAKQHLFSCLYKGMEHNRFLANCDKFKAYIENDARPEILEKLRKHQSDGDTAIIVSASIGDWIRPWAKDIGIDNVIATEVEVDASGKLTGRFRTLNCHGPEKANRIRECISRIEDYETWGYGDSSGDDAMLALVNHPHKLKSK